MLKKSVKRGFTLIELLVVIAIIAILAAILFPVFAQAKLAAKKASDLSNEKQILTSVMIYMGDADDMFPMLRNSPSRWQNPVLGEQINSGHIAVNPYAKNRKIWLSPNDTMPRCDGGNVYKSPSDESLPTGGGISYVFTYNNPAAPNTSFGISGWGTTGLTASSLTSSQVGQSASTIFLMPSYISWSYWTGLMQHRNDQRQYAFPPSVLASSIMADWPNVVSLPGIWCGSQDAAALGNYGGITNWGFADGHAKAMKREQIMDREWATNLTNAVATNRRNLIHWDERYKN